MACTGGNHMFQKILVANRGEIAVRIIKTIQELNMKAVAVYSKADQDASFVQDADEAYFIGDAQVQKSYLNIEAMMKVAKKANVDAIHPGYGYLAENSEFALACEKIGITFIGPPAHLIYQMNHKLTAKQRMKKANIPTVPGPDEVIESVEHAKQVASSIGYPVMLKATEGRGGIGISIIHDAAALEQQFSDSKQRAAMYFGKDDLFIEKYIPDARQIDIQVVRDHQGKALHLYERECSVQRKHQKIIAEAPSVTLPAQIRDILIEAALRATEAIEYENVGTIEFLLDEDFNFYFLEMNTSIQPEHTVTEETLGLNIVEMQIKLACGFLLPYEQTDIVQHGHAIDCLVYAEDPINYYPSPGEITTLHITKEQHARYDLGVCEGDMITPFYEPLLGKIITHCLTRKQAIATMHHVLAETKITGVKTNLSILQSVMQNDKFTNGVYTTNILNKEMIK